MLFKIVIFGEKNQIAISLKTVEEDEGDPSCLFVLPMYVTFWSTEQIALQTIIDCKVWDI